MIVTLPISVTLPIRTVSEANRRGHWWKAHKRNKQQQHTVAWTFRARCGTGHVPCVVTMTRVAPRRLDPGNLEVSFKNVQDGIAKWLGVDDGDASKVSWRYEQEQGKAKEYAVRVEIAERVT